jgi:hypothetical protein
MISYYSTFGFRVPAVYHAVYSCNLYAMSHDPCPET